jgi:hypothetical protein
MIVRKKLVAIDGASVTIAALSISQARKLFAEEAASAPTRGDIVVLSLNNARTNGEPEWTVERTQEEFDSVLFMRLYDEIIDFCGLKPEETTQGESPAPSPN